MGVYIKGMEMPENCGECLLAKLSPTGESLICNYMLSRVSWEERPFDCPLVPVPPHGRLIDADALYERAKMRSERFNGCFNDLDNVINALYIETFPTVLEAEEGET